MTTDVVDSAVYPTSSTFFYSNDLSESNPLAVKKEGFDFNAKHNGVSCIASFNPMDQGTERQFRFTVAMMCANFCVSDQTIRNKWERLRKQGEISNSNFLELLLPGNSKPSLTCDLTVFNKTAMTMDSDVAIDIRSKFNDVIIKAETQAPMMCLPQDYESALEALLSKVRENKALQAQRDEAVRSKYLFVEGRDAKVCGELGGLRTQNEALRKQIGDSKRYKAVSAITWITDYFDISNRGVYGSLASKLKKVEEEMGAGYEHINIPDSKYGTVKAYHVDVIERLHAMIQSDESLMAKYRKILSV